MANYSDRYAGAVFSGNLKSDPDTAMSDVDVIGAAGIAAKRSPLALALLRLFVGDNHAGEELVTLLENMVVGKAYRLTVTITRPEARDVGKAVLGWHREGTCKTCHGHGFNILAGTTTIGDETCPKCRGEGKIPFDREFPVERRELARWLLAEMEREQAIAGPAAMAALAPKLNF